MPKDYQHCLDKLAATAPERKSALIRSLLPGIEAALNSGQCLKAIWEALRNAGLEMGYRSFYMTVSRARKMKKRTAASGWGKQDNPPEPHGLTEARIEAVEARDPFANLKRLEENRPGFHWRGTQSVKTMGHGADVSTDKSNR